jgi:hypothetical protein
MNSLDNITNLIFNTQYWKEYREVNKIKKILSIFFTGEDEVLQKSFVKNFNYPEEMVNSPVRVEKTTGDIYYTINFKSKELFENTETKANALSNSLAILDKHLPLGITQYIEPQPPIDIPDTFTILCSLRVQSEISLKRTIWNLVGSIIKPIAICSIFTLIILAIR